MVASVLRRGTLILQSMAWFASGVCSLEGAYVQRHHNRAVQIYLTNPHVGTVEKRDGVVGPGSSLSIKYSR